MIYADILLAALELLFAAGLFVLAAYAEKVLSSFWRILYALPLIVCGVITAIAGFEISMAGIYLGAAFLVMGFVREEKKIRQGVCIAAALCMLLSCLVCNVNAGYRAPDYVADFKKAFSELKAGYVLADYKGIDWDALYAFYLPQFIEADKEHDEVKNAILWQKLTCEFHDGHVGYGAEEEIAERQVEQSYGNDYGLSVITLANGQTVAVNVEKDSQAAKAGIHNGTVITGWNGKTVEAAEEEADMPLMVFPVAENEAFYKGLLAAGTGGEQVSVDFLDDSGEKQRAELSKLGAYSKRLNATMDILHQGVEGDNLSWHDLDEQTVCLRIKEMMYDSQSYETGNHAQMEEEIRNRLLSLKQEGITNLILDLRSNSGGSAQFNMALAKLLSPVGEHEYAYDAVWDEEKKAYKRNEENGQYVAGERITYEGEDVWADGRIVILVNAQTVSAGDHLSKLLSQFDNVTLMGFTGSMCAGQGTSGIRLSQGILSYSAVPVLNADGTILIDPDTSRETTIPLDVKIPLDEAAVNGLFDEGRDYVLDYVMQYLK